MFKILRKKCRGGSYNPTTDEYMDKIPWNFGSIRNNLGKPQPHFRRKRKKVCRIGKTTNQVTQRRNNVL